MNLTSLYSHTWSVRKHYGIFWNYIRCCCGRMSSHGYIALYLILQIVLLAGCSSSKRVHTSHTPSAVALSKTTSVDKSIDDFEMPKNISAFQRDLIYESLSWMATPYKYGANERGVATDCSGMVLMVYDRFGYKLPRNSAAQMDFCNKIEATDAKTGDLVFFATGSDPDRVSHVGIIIDADRFIHASSSKGVVISHLSNPYYQRTLRGYGRVPGVRI